MLQPQPGFVQTDGTRLPATTHLTITPVTASVLPDLVDALVAAADDVRGLPPVDTGGLLSGLPALVGRPDAETAAAVLRGLGLPGSVDAGPPATDGRADGVGEPCLQSGRR